MPEKSAASIFTVMKTWDFIPQLNTKEEDLVTDFKPVKLYCIRKPTK
jgi:hypothetical protein